MRESQIKEIKAYYSTKLKNKIPADNNTAGQKYSEISSKPFFNSVMDKLNIPPQK